MIKSIQSIPALVKSLLVNVENEVVEFKEAKNSFDLDRLGRYFSALSNEANLHGAECGWLLFGITDKREICGTKFYLEDKSPSVGLQKLKYEVARYLNDGITFEEIYEVMVDSKRVVAFQIPPCGFAKPTTWRGIPYSRENESLVDMPTFKLRAILEQSRPDWSAQIAFEARIEDLDEEAVAFARERYLARYAESTPALTALSNEDLLKKMGFLVRGRVTNAALVLLGKPESVAFLNGAAPRITWSLYNSKGKVEAYEHFNPPFILQVNRILGKIRNERYRTFDSEATMFPTLTTKYDVEVLRELLHNAIAHQDYRLTSKINLLEYEDKLLFVNEGSFIPGTIEKALETGYRPHYYRNLLLSDVMSKTDMIDQNAIGIRNVFDIQRNRLLPLPSYDLSEPNRVSVTVFGRVLNDSYTRLLSAEPELELEIVYLLDRVQKRQPITKEQGKILRQRALVEGRYPKLYISSKVASAIGTHEEYVRQKGLDSSICKELIVKLLKTKPCSRVEIVSAIDYALPEKMTAEQKSKHTGYLLQALRKEGRIRNDGYGNTSTWTLVE